MCLLIILREHASSIGAPDILRGHGVKGRVVMCSCCSREVLIWFVIPLKLICFNEKNKFTKSNL